MNLQQRFVNRRQREGSGREEKKNEKISTK
jgi:hypothetical protein